MRRVNPSRYLGVGSVHPLAGVYWIGLCVRNHPQDKVAELRVAFIRLDSTVSFSKRSLSSPRCPSSKP